MAFSPSTATATETTAVSVVNTASSQLSRARAPPDKCVVYWDYENMQIPRDRSLTEIISAVRERVHDEIGAKLPVEFKVYILAEKLTPKITNDFDINGVIQIQIPSKKPEAVDKRLICDIMFDVYELERDHKSRAIALISGDKDFGHTLSKIKDVPPISHSFLILLRHVDMQNMHTSVHKVLQFEFGAAAAAAAGHGDASNQSPPMPTRSHSARKHQNYAYAYAGRANGGSRGFRGHQRYPHSFGRQRYRRVSQQSHAQRSPPQFQNHSFQQQQQFVHADHYNHNHNHQNFAHDQQLQSQLLDMYSQSAMDASHDQKVADDPPDVATLNPLAPEFKEGYASNSIPVSSPEPNSGSKQKLTLKMVSCLDHKECVVITSKASNQIQNVRHQLHEKIKRRFGKADKSQLTLYHKNDQELRLRNCNETLQQAGIGDGDTLFWFYELDAADMALAATPIIAPDVDPNKSDDDDDVVVDANAQNVMLGIAQLELIMNSVAPLNVNFMVRLQSLDGDQTFECCVNRKEYVLIVRRKVFDIVATTTRLRDERGIALVYDGKELMDHAVIDEVGIKDGEILLYDVDENCASDIVSSSLQPKTDGLILAHKPGDYPTIVRAMDPQATLHFLKTLVLHRFSGGGSCADIDRVWLEYEGKRIDNGDEDDANRTLLQCGLKAGDELKWVFNTDASASGSGSLNGEEEDDDEAGGYVDEDEDIDEEDDEKESQLTTDHKQRSSSDMSVEVAADNDGDDNEVVKDMSFSPSHTPAPPQDRDNQVVVTVHQEWNNSERSIALARTSTISDLKRHIEERLGMKSAEQILEIIAKDDQQSESQHGRYLADDENNECVSKYASGGKFEVRLRIVQAFHVKVEVLQGEQIDGIPVSNNMRVDVLKRRLSERTGLAPVDMILIFKENPMQDTHCLYHYKVRNDDVIKLNCKDF